MEVADPAGPPLLSMEPAVEVADAAMEDADPVAPPLLSMDPTVEVADAAMEVWRRRRRSYALDLCSFATLTVLCSRKFSRHEPVVAHVLVTVRAAYARFVRRVTNWRCFVPGADCYGVCLRSSVHHSIILPINTHT